MSDNTTKLPLSEAIERTKRFADDVLRFADGYSVELNDDEMMAVFDALNETQSIGTDFDRAYDKLAPLHKRMSERINSATRAKVSMIDIQPAPVAVCGSCRTTPFILCTPKQMIKYCACGVGIVSERQRQQLAEKSINSILAEYGMGSKG